MPRKIFHFCHGRFLFPPLPDNALSYKLTPHQCNRITLAHADLQSGITWVDCQQPADGRSFL